jgi:hypothetical protein
LDFDGLCPFVSVPLPGVCPLGLFTFETILYPAFSDRKFGTSSEQCTVLCALTGGSNEIFNFTIFYPEVLYNKRIIIVNIFLFLPALLIPSHEGTKTRRKRGKIATESTEDTEKRGQAKV